MLLLSRLPLQIPLEIGFTLNNSGTNGKFLIEIVAFILIYNFEYNTDIFDQDCWLENSKNLKKLEVIFGLFAGMPVKDFF